MFRPRPRPRSRNRSCPFCEDENEDDLHRSLFRACPRIRRSEPSSETLSETLSKFLRFSQLSTKFPTKFPIKTLKTGPLGTSSYFSGGNPGANWRGALLRFGGRLDRRSGSA